MGRRNRKTRRLPAPASRVIKKGRRKFCAYSDAKLDAAIKRANQQTSKQQLKGVNKVLGTWKRWQTAREPDPKKRNLLLAKGSVTMVELRRFVTYCLHDIGDLPRYALTTIRDVYIRSLILHLRINDVHCDESPAEAEAALKKHIKGKFENIYIHDSICFKIKYSFVNDCVLNRYVKRQPDFKEATNCSWYVKTLLLC